MRPPALLQYDSQILCYNSAMTQPTDFDSPWKAILDTYLAEFFAFCLPHVYTEIDWSRAAVPLDKELQQVVRDAEIGRRLADKLVQVWRQDGTDAWVLIHIEVQSQEEVDFAQRMFSLGLTQLASPAVR